MKGKTPIKLNQKVVIMKKYLAIAAIAVCASGPAMADHDKNADHWFDKIDTDKNGVITKSEHTAFSENKFNKIDTNKDGTISREELRAHKEAKKSGWNKEVNTTKDPKKYNSKQSEREYDVDKH